MKVIVAGSRNINDYDLVNRVIEESKFGVTEIVSGGARGVDGTAIMWAEENRIPCRVFIARWERSKSAGYLRNSAMAHYADALIAIWDGESKGTKHMIDIANTHGLSVFIHQTNTDSVYISTPYMRSLSE
jgi:hypothetical protein